MRPAQNKDFRNYDSYILSSEVSNWEEFLECLFHHLCCACGCDCSFLVPTAADAAAAIAAAAAPIFTPPAALPMAAALAKTAKPAAAVARKTTVGLNSIPFLVIVL
jgi:hypothetical protein